MKGRRCPEQQLSCACQSRYQTAISMVIVQAASSIAGDNSALFMRLGHVALIYAQYLFGSNGILCLFSLSSAVDDCATLTSHPFLSSFRQPFSTGRLIAATDCVHGSGVSHRHAQSAAIRVGFTPEVQACITCKPSSQGASRGTSHVEALCAICTQA